METLSRFPPGAGAPDVVFDAARAAGVGLELERPAAGKAYELLPLLEPSQYLTINLSPAAAIDLVGRASEIPETVLQRLVREITEHGAVQNYAELRDCPRRHDGAGCGLRSTMPAPAMPPCTTSSSSAPTS